MKDRIMTEWVFLWEDPDGVRKWEAINEGQIDGFCEKLLRDGVNPATVMIACGPILFHWVWKEFHRGLSDVYFQHINDEIYGENPVEGSRHTPVEVPIRKKPETKFGWAAPDGRFFGCDYGGHSCLAGEIVGKVERVQDAERYLEDLGWAKIFSGRPEGKRYTIGMGNEKKLTDAQIKTLQQMGLDAAYGISRFL